MGSEIYLPGIACGDGLHVENSTGSYQDHKIDLSPEIVEMLSYIIIQREMDQIRREHPEVDLQRIQEMLDSGDVEMRNLGYSTLQQYTIYTYKLMILTNKYSVIQDYLRSNRYNIGGKVR